MYARMIHSVLGVKQRQPYGKPDQHILSIDRRHLNEYLLTVAESHPNVHLHYEHKLTDCNVRTGELAFRAGTEQTSSKMTFDAIFGNDGVYSRIRQAVMRSTRMDYNQAVLSHGYKELTLPPSLAGDFAMEADCLHIWPRGTFMMIALPNLDKSFTLTLFLPWSTFDVLQSQVGRAVFRGEPSEHALRGKKDVPNVGQNRTTCCSFFSSGSPILSILLAKNVCSRIFFRTGPVP